MLSGGVIGSPMIDDVYGESETLEADSNQSSTCGSVVATDS